MRVGERGIKKEKKGCVVKRESAKGKRRREMLSVGVHCVL